MAMSRMTILGLLEKTNKGVPKNCHLKQQPPAYCTLEEKEIIISITAQQILNSQRIISRAVNRWRLRKLAKMNKYIVDIFYEADPDIANEVYLVGEFSNPQWKEPVLMNYSYFFRAFRAKVTMHEDCQFKFIVDGTFVCCPKYLLTYTPEKFTNNIFRTSSSKNRCSDKPISDFSGVAIFVNNKRAVYYRKKNSHIINKATNMSFPEPNM